MKMGSLEWLPSGRSPQNRWIAYRSGNFVEPLADVPMVLLDIKPPVLRLPLQTLEEGSRP